MAINNILKELQHGCESQKISVGELFYIKNGYTPRKSEESYWIDGNIPWITLKDIRNNQGTIDDSLCKITKPAVKGKLFQKNSLVMSTTATIGVHSLVTVDHLCNQQLTNFSVKDSYVNIVSIKYLYYCFFNFGEWCISNANKSGGLSIISLDTLCGYQIDIPYPNDPKKSLEIQNEIVRILDKFTLLVTELKTELNLRQLQYEYYRNMLIPSRNGGVK